jgi:hypothetical protein
MWLAKLYFAGHKAEFVGINVLLLAISSKK